jgi:hypothetical protein
VEQVICGSKESDSNAAIASFEALKVSSEKD